MDTWRIPARGEILPVSDTQSCVVCGSPDWSWLYLLLRAPAWVQQRGWFANWFVTMCAACRMAWEQEPQDALPSRWAMNDAHGEGGSGPNLNEFREVVIAMQSEPPVTRSVATAL